jgi:hypothetical protein
MQLISFFNLEVLKRKLTKSIKIMPHPKHSKTYAFETKKLKRNQNCNSYGLMKIWSNFNHLKVLNY